MKQFFCMLAVFFAMVNAGDQTAQPVLSLKSALEMGLRNNPEVKSAYDKIRAAQGRGLVAVSPPPLSFSATSDYVPTGTGIGNYGEKTVGLSQSIEFPTTYLLRGSKYSKETEIARREYELVKLAALGRIKTAYFSVLAQQRQLEIARENSVIVEDFRKKAQIRYSIGEGTNLEQITARVQYAEARNEVEVRKNQLLSAFAGLNQALGHGREQSISYRLSDSLDYVPVHATFDSLLAVAADSNPALEIGRLRVHTASLDNSLAWSALLPEMNVGLFSKEVRGDAARYYGASVSLAIPLWFMLDQRGKIMEASANRSSAESELKATDNGVYLRTKSAFVEFGNAERQVGAYRENILPQAEESYRIASKSYAAGEITYLEFLQAQQMIMRAKSDYIDALLSYNLAVVSLEQTIGKTL